MEVTTTEARYVRLAQLPSGIEFPTELKDRVFYDSAGKRLVFRGHMSRAIREKLIRLDSDVLYHQAVFRLYMGNRRRPPWSAIVVAVLILGFLAAAAIHWMRG